MNNRYQINGAVLFQYLHRVLAANLAFRDHAVTIRELDPDAARRALDNVLDNAIKFAGSADLRVTRAAGQAVAEIIDHGPGLPAEAFGRVTEPFYRLEPSRSQETGGAGLGLAIVQALVRQIGGGMELSPTPGGGLTVRLALPAG